MPHRSVARVVLLLCWLACQVDGKNVLHLYGHGNADANSYQCNAMGIPLPTGCTPGQCSHCAPQLLLPNVTAACTGRAHTLVVLANGTLLGTGARALLGVGVESGSLSCTNGSWERIWLPNATDLPTDVACSPTTSAVRTKGNVTYVFGFNAGGLFGVQETDVAYGPTPQPVNASGSNGGQLVPLTPVSGILLSSGSLTVLLANGSVLLFGTGVVASSGSAATGAVPSGSANATMLPLPCGGQSGAVALTGGLATAAVRCANGSFFGWGVNTQGQLNATGTAIQTPSMLQPANSSGTFRFVSVAMGNTHTVAVDALGGTWGRGDNSAGQLGLPSSTASVTADWVLLPRFPQALGPFAASAGSDYSVVIAARKAAGRVPATGTDFYSNAYAAGSNAACALGTGVNASALATLFGTALVEFPPASGKISGLTAKAVIAGEFRRVLMLVLPGRTATPSATPRTATPTSTAPTPTPTSTSPALTASPTTTASATRLTTTATWTSSFTSSVTPSASPSPSASATNTQTPSRTDGSVTVSTTQAPSPKIVKITLLQWEQQPAAFIYFDIATNQYASDTTRTVPFSASVDRLFRVSGRKQSFGSFYNGAWYTASEFHLFLDILSSNMTAGVARIAVAPGNNIRDESGRSLPSEPTYFQNVVAQPSYNNSIRDGTVSFGVPDAVKVGIIAVCVSLGSVAVVAICITTLRARHLRALRREEEKLADLVRARAAVAHLELVPPTSLLYNEVDRIDDAITFSSLREFKRVVLKQPNNPYGLPGDGIASEVPIKPRSAVLPPPKGPSGAFVTLPLEPPCPGAAHPDVTAKLRRLNESFWASMNPVARVFGHGSRSSIPPCDPSACGDAAEGTVVLMREQTPVVALSPDARQGAFHQLSPTTSPSLSHPRSITRVEVDHDDSQPPSATG